MRLATVALCVLPISFSRAQEPGCAEISALAMMARAQSVAALKARAQKTKDSYRSRLILAARTLELDPQNRPAAESLLNMLPKDELGPEQGAWLNLSELEECPTGGISEPDLKPLDGLQDRLPRDAAKAVLLAPAKMLEYISYAPFSVNPESDYAVQMEKVCKARHALFAKAVDQLSPNDRRWLITKVFNPESCRAIALPEAY